MLSLRLLCVVLLIAQSVFAAEGHVNYAFYTNSNTDQFTDSPTTAQQQWMQSHFAEMIVYTNYFDSRLSWFPNASVYQDMYAIYNPSDLANQHPEWILKDSSGNKMFIPWGCSSGTCPQYAADIGNPAYRAYWISQSKAILAKGYPGLFIDDVNMEFRVGNGNGDQVAPIDSNTQQTMTWDAWRNYVATFMEEVKTALPTTRITHNSLWFSNPTGSFGQDVYINRQIMASNRINIERGITNDTGLTGGTGFWSIFNLFAFIDSLHNRGKNINWQEYGTTPLSQEYGLAGYFLVNAGSDTLGDETANPNNWFSGYSVDLGTANGFRTYNNGVYQRTFSGGMVLLGEPGLSQRTISLPGTFTKLDGTQVTSVSLQGSQGYVLRGSVTPPPPVPPSPLPTVVTHQLSDLSPVYLFNGWGTLRKDKSILGHTLTLNGVQYAKGLGLHSYAEQRFDLAALGGCALFTAKVGIDDEIKKGYGWATFQIWADGLLLYDSGYMKSRYPTKSVNVNLTGRALLSVVTTGGVYDATTGVDYDHTDWVNPILTCVK